MLILVIEQTPQEDVHDNQPHSQGHRAAFNVERVQGLGEFQQRLRVLIFDCRINAYVKSEQALPL